MKKNENEMMCVYVEKVIAAIAAVLTISLVVSAVFNPLNALVAFPLFAISKALYGEAKTDETRINLTDEQTEKAE